jgi:hypothetical protein
MTRSYVFGLILVWIAVFLSPAALPANPAPWPISGGTVSSKGPHETIRMEAEEVTIRLGNSVYTVEGVYHMVNSGEATTEWVGFPKNLDKKHDMTDRNFVQFHAWADGKKISLAEEGRQWLAGRIDFAAHATTIIRIMYEAAYPVSFVAFREWADYIVGTGSLWKGNIGKAIFTVDGSALGREKNFDAELKIPQSRKLRSGQVIRFDATDFKPERDATLVVNIDGRRRGHELPAGETSESQ